MTLRYSILSFFVCKKKRTFVTYSSHIIFALGVEAIRKEAERMDALQNFAVFHGLAGGTGSGLGSLLLQYLEDSYPSLFIGEIDLLPSEKIVRC